MLINAEAVVLRSHRLSRVLTSGSRDRVRPMSAPSLPQRSYDRVAPIYDLLARVWTGGAIGEAGAEVARHVEAGQRVLFAGAGAGRDAAALAGVGAALTLVDLSGRMLARAGRRVRDAGGTATLLAADVRELEPEGGFDVVCAHYFLNVFGPDEMPEVFAHLSGHVAIGGLLSVADFAPSTGSPLQQLHYRLPLAVFRALGLCADHPIYDYAQSAPGGLALESTVDHRVFGQGPPWHRTWLFRRVS